MTPSSEQSLAVMDPGILTEILKSLIGVFTENFSIISGYASSILWNLIFIEIVILGILIALGKTPSAGDLFSKLLMLGMFTFLIAGYIELIDVIIRSFIQAGLVSSGNQISVAEFLNPSGLFWKGFEIIEPLEKELAASGNSLFGIVRSFPLFLMVSFIVISFVMMAFQIVLTLLEFYIVSGLAVIFLPFGVNKHTSFLADKAIAGILASGFKVMVLAAVTGASWSVLERLFSGVTADLSFSRACSLMAASMLLGMLVYRAPSIASGMISGTSNLDVASSMVQPAISMVSSSMTTARMSTSVMKGAGKAGRGIKSVANAVKMARK